jgi:hypothetical protein
VSRCVWRANKSTSCDAHFGYDAAGNLVHYTFEGDMDCDGDVDYDDIDALTLAITDPEEYAETYPDCVIELGDLNDDGEVDFDDIDYFSGILAGGWEGRTFTYDEENRLTRVAHVQCYW